jgi:predicted transcriptional regulator
MEMTKDSDFKSFLIVPLEDWNPYLLSPKRKELLEIIRKRKISSETQLAKIVQRKRPNVVADLKLLEHYGLIKLERDGNKMIPKPEKTQIIII